MPVFVDTNVLVYRRDSSDQPKQGRAHEWMHHLWRTRNGRLSFQVLHEYYATVTAKLDPGLPPDEARADVRDLVAWDPITPDGDILEDAWQLMDRHSVSFWDALIVASARRASCDRLLTEDLSDNETYDGVVVVNPFTHHPDDDNSPPGEPKH